MTLMKNVNGNMVEMSPEEEAAFKETTNLVSTRKREMQQDAEHEYQATLARGFTDSNGVRWSATSDAREKTMALTLRINAGKGLPNGKTKMRLRDANNQPHDVDAAGVESLAEQGIDFKDKAEDRFAQLYGQIDAATTHSDLDAIDVTSGWPT